MFIWEQQGLQFGICGRMVNHEQIQRNKGEELSSIGGAIVNEEFIGGN